LSRLRKLAEEKRVARFKVLRYLESEASGHHVLGGLQLRGYGWVNFLTEDETPLRSLIPALTLSESTPPLCASPLVPRSIRKAG
jgi:hypothetical protein